MSKRITEQYIEDVALDILENDLNYEYIHGEKIAPKIKTSSNLTY